MSAPAAAPNDFTPTAWAHLRDILALIGNLFGLPTALALMQFMPRAIRKDMLIWLRAAETLARRVLLIEASQLPRPNLLPRAPHKKGVGGVHGKAGHASENSEDWSVSFKVVPPARKRRLRKPFNARPLHHNSTRPLAERLEALIRVAANPEAYAHRLARRLYAKPARAMRIPAQDCASKTNPLRSMLLEAQPLSYSAASVFRDSS